MAEPGLPVSHTDGETKYKLDSLSLESAVRGGMLGFEIPFQKTYNMMAGNLV